MTHSRISISDQSQYPGPVRVGSAKMGGRSITPGLSQTFLLMILVLLLAGCNMSAQEQVEARFCATQYAQSGTLPIARCGTLAAEYYGVSLPIAVGTPTPNPYYTPTLSVMDIGLTQAALMRSDQLTSDAAALQLERDRIAAEERARVAAENARRQEETAVAIRQEQTAQAVVMYARQTSDAISTEQMSTVQAGWTVTSGIQTQSAIGTATAYPMTVTMQPTSDFLTQRANEVAAAIAEAERRKVELAVERQEAKNLLDAYGYWALLIGLTVAFVIGFREYVRLRMHARDEAGRKQSFSYTTKDGALVTVDLGRMHTPIVKITPGGDVIQYQGATDEEQARINHDEKVVDALAALPSSYAQLAPGLINANFGRNGGARIQVSVDTSTMGGTLEEADRNFMEVSGGRND